MNSSPVDDSTAAYILITRKCFENLRQVAAQIAGVLVLAASGAKSAVSDHPMLAAAAELHRETLDELRGIRPTERARQHHNCLLRAAEALSRALSLSVAAARRLEVDAVLIPVRQAYAQLQDAGRMLPGFPMVAFEHGCCAVGL